MGGVYDRVVVAAAVIAKPGGTPHPTFSTRRSVLWSPGPGDHASRTASAASHGQRTIRGKSEVSSRPFSDHKTKSHRVDRRARTMPVSMIAGDIPESNVTAEERGKTCSSGSSPQTASCRFWFKYAMKSLMSPTT